MADDAWKIAHELSVEVTRMLGAARVQSVTVYGSLVHDAFVAGQSDIDMLVLLSETLEDDDLAALEHMHWQFVETHPEWFDRIEVQYVPAEAMPHFKTAKLDAAIISPGEPFHAATVGPDWLQNWYDVREFGVTLVGEPAGMFMPPISQDEFVAAIGVYAAELAARTLRPDPLLRGALAYVVLSLCRAQYTIATGRPISKQDALALALTEFPAHRTLFDWVKVVREGTSESQHASTSPVERERAKPFVEAVISDIGGTSP